jgi:hypothetical protein
MVVVVVVVVVAGGDVVKELMVLRTIPLELAGVETAR